MDNVVRTSKSVTYTILDGVMSTAILLISLAAADRLMDGEFSPYMFMILFFALTGMRVVQAALYKEKVKKGVLRNIVEAGIYGVIAFILLVWGIDASNCILIMVLYLLDMLAGRIFAIIHGKRLLGRIFNGIISAGLIYLGISTIVIEEGNEGDFLLILLVMIVVRTLAHIIALSFSQIQLDILMKIIRRTYALEIIFGLVMLIATFSYVFTFVERNTVKNYWDGLWYCFAIVTTIGFGDISATSIVGRGLSVILGIYGIVVVSMVTSIIINFYNEMKEIQEKERQKELEMLEEKKRKKKAKKKKKIEVSEEGTEEESEVEGETEDESEEETEEKSEEETEEESEEETEEESEEETEEESEGEGKDKFE